MTRPLEADPSDDRLATLLRAAGHAPYPFPLTRIIPPTDAAPLEDAAARAHTFDWIVFTSRRAVAPFVAAMGEGAAELRRTRAGARSTAHDAPSRRAGPAILAVGPATAEALERAALPPDLLPERFVAEGVVQALAAAAPGARPDLSGLRVLLPRAEEGRELIPEEVRRLGGEIEVVAAYRTVPHTEGAERLAEAVAAGGLDVVSFTAGSAARSFGAAWREREGGAPAARAPGWPDGVRVVAIGPATAEALEKQGLPVHAEADPHTLEALVEAIAAAVRPGPSRPTGEGS